MRALLRHGEERGHIMVRTHLLDRPRFDSLSEVDLVLLVDVWNQPGHWKRGHRRLARLIPFTSQARYWRRVRRALEGRYVHVDNAYVDICDLPYLPCNGAARGPMCPFKAGPDRRCFAWRNRSVYERSTLNWFLSPLHRDVVTRRLESGSLPPSDVCRPLIDPEPFRAASRPDAERSIRRLYVGPLTEAKGLHEVLRLYDPSSIDVVGRTPSDVDLKPVVARFASWRPPVRPDEMPALLGDAREVLFLPRWPEPQGRVALEASLAGCKVIANDRVGALSFVERPDDDRLYGGAADEFWRRAEATAGSS